MYGMSHEGMVLHGVHYLYLHAFIRVEHLVMGWAMKVLVSACATLFY